MNVGGSRSRVRLCRSSRFGLNRLIRVLIHQWISSPRMPVQHPLANPASASLEVGEVLEDPADTHFGNGW